MRRSTPECIPEDAETAKYPAAGTRTSLTSAHVTSLLPRLYVTLTDRPASLTDTLRCCKTVEWNVLSVAQLPTRLMWWYFSESTIRPSFV